MSALPITPAPRPAGRPHTTPRPRLRLVTAEEPAAPASVGDRGDGLAPATPAQARRRRAVALALAALLLVAAVVGVVAASARPATVAPAVAPITATGDATVVVRPGQTVWEVAAATAPPGVGTATQAAAIVELNGLDGSVEEWQVLRLPTP